MKNKSKAGMIGVRSALIGSLLFAIVQGLTMQGFNETDALIEVTRFELLLMGFVFCYSSLLSSIPGYFGSRFLDTPYRKGIYNRRSLMMWGAIIGVVIVAIISLPNLWLALVPHNYWSMKNNSQLLIYVFQLIQVVIIAALMGSWSGSQIAKS